MSGQTPTPTQARLLELLADRALCGLTDAEQLELETLCRDLAACTPEFCELDAAAGELAAAVAASSVETCPAKLREKLARTADSWCTENCTVAARIGPGTGVTRRPLPALGWLVAAASLAVAVWLGLPKRAPNVGEQFAKFQQAAADAVRADWVPFNDLTTKAPPQVTGVTGQVLWSEAQHRGFMVLDHLPDNDPSIEQYQLWIVDSRGLGQRVSGAVFNADKGGHVIVPIDPLLPVHGAQIFAITIEKPGGTWVSDMSRRVVMAVVGKG